MTPNSVKRKRGGQRKHWAEEARVWIWYCHIKRHGDWSDYALDNEFAWTDKGKATRTEDSLRPRTFEWIRKKSRKPAGQDRDKRWRDINELVLAVDQHPDFNGTLAVYRSEFWHLLQEQTWAPIDVKWYVEQLLETNNLIRIDPRKSVVFSDLIKKFGRDQIFDRCLLLSLRKVDELTAISLTWFLYLQAEPRQNASIREIVESIADSQLDRFFRRYYSLDDHLNKYSKAIDALLNLKLNMTESNIGGYGFLETYGVWPIIPSDLQNTISEDHLFLNLEKYMLLKPLHI